MNRHTVSIAAISAALAVLLGAFGSHALKARLDPQLLSTYQTGVAYHFYHSLALLAVGILQQQRPQLRALLWSARLFLLGLLLFSGSLYCLALTGVRSFGMVAPFGGLSFVAGWLLLAWSFRRG